MAGSLLLVYYAGRVVGLIERRGGDGGGLIQLKWGAGYGVLIIINKCVM
jgi:hypothetical protein